MILRYVFAFFMLGALAAEPRLTARQQAEDFDTAWRAIEAGYAYFQGGHHAWRRARDVWRPRAQLASTRAQFVAALEGALGELHDDNVTLSERTHGSHRRVPADTDIWARWRGGAARVEAVRAFGDADVAGLRPGARVTRIDDQPVDKAVNEVLGGARGASAEDRDWALRHALAGPPAGVLRLEVSDGERSRRLEIERTSAARANSAPLIARRMGEERNLGYIRIRQGLGEAKLVEQFEGALHYMKETRALIVDLRDTSGPGSREVTQGILRLFAASETPWQLREDARGNRVADKVAPRAGAAYRAPVVVLVDRWTAGEGEALAAGLVAVAGARLIGTPMAGLRGELREVKLPHSGIAIRFPGERTFHVDGTPREKLRPHVEVDLAAPSGGPGDPILYQGLKVLEKRR